MSETLGVLWYLFDVLTKQVLTETQLIQTIHDISKSIDKKETVRYGHIRFH